MRDEDKTLLRTVKMCEIPNCNSVATVFITTTLSKHRYCGYHFSVSLFSKQIKNVEEITRTYTR